MLVVLTLFSPFNLQASTDNKYQKSFRSFKRETKGCAPATTTSTPGFVERALFVGAVLPTAGANITVAAVPDTGTPPLQCFFWYAPGAAAVRVVSHAATFVKAFMKRGSAILPLLCCSTFSNHTYFSAR